jgi:hypothetical protein
MILVLLLAFNLSAPNAGLMNLRNRHLIEFAQENHTKSLTKNEMVRNKAVTYLNLFVIMSVMERMENQNRIEFNSS